MTIATLAGASVSVLTPATERAVPERPIRVAVAHGHRYLREGVRSLLAAEPGMEVVGTACDGAELCSLVEEARPDVLIGGPTLGGKGVTVEYAICRRGGSPRLIVMIPRARPSDMRALLESGASGLVPDDHAVADLVAAIRAVASGHIALDPGLAAAMALEPAAAAALTTRERQVLGLIAAGQNNGEIGQALGIGIKTVDTHRRMLYRKLDAHNTGELLMRAMRFGLLDP